MNEEIRADKRTFERAYLVGVQFPDTTASEVREHLSELESLVKTLGTEVVGCEVVKIRKPSPKFLVGDGKAEEIMARVADKEADVLIFDDDLAAPQQHLWEAKTKIAVIDRRKVIIDIFAQRAQTREARLQIELASMEYMLPRLKRAWTHLERQRGGGGFIGGAGEAQIEIDRRLVRDKIAKLRKELDTVRKSRATQRKRRDKKPVPNAALVGYTNSGKSSLLNTLTKAGVLQEDKLFATLDPTTRRIDLPNNQEMLLTDTVGFIRKLPTTLVEAFKSTLEEATEADFLLHVLDASHPRALEHYEVTNKILKELGAEDKQTIVVLNKADAVEDWYDLARFRMLPEKVVVTSTYTGQGISVLRQAIAALLSGRLADLHLRIPTSRYDLVSAIYREGEVLEQKYERNDVLMHVLFPRKRLEKVRQYATSPW